MTDQTNTTPAAPEDNGLRTSVESTYTPKSYAIDPEDWGLANEILATDPVEDVASGVKFDDNRVLNLKATALPAEQRRPIEEHLEQIPHDQRAGAEARLVAAAIRSNRPATRLAIGNAPDAFRRVSLNIVSMPSV